jgi:hypothetical protein
MTATEGVTLADRQTDVTRTCGYHSIETVHSRGD